MRHKPQLRWGSESIGNSQGPLHCQNLASACLCLSHPPLPHPGQNTTHNNHNNTGLDRAVTVSERQMVTNYLSDATDKAKLHAVTSPHSSDWLNALLLSGCSLQLDDRTIHFAVDLWLGANIWKTRQCLCGTFVGARGFLSNSNQFIPRTSLQSTQTALTAKFTEFKDS